MTGFLPLGALSMWVTPAWELAAGIAGATIVIAALYFLFRLVMSRYGVLIDELSIGGLGAPIFYISLVPAVLALVGLPWALDRAESADAQTSAAEIVNQDTLAIQAAVIVGCTLIGVFLLYGLVRLVLPKVSAIAVTTAKEAMSQSLYWFLMIIGVLALVFAVWIPYFTFGEDHKVYKDLGLTLIMLLALFQALWTASISISDEVEGRTSLTVLSKPISRWQFIVGKYLGILAPTLVMFYLLGIVFLMGLSYKVGSYDPAENGVTHLMTERFIRMEIYRVLPGLILGFMEVMVLASIAVTISTRLPMAANLAICSSVYVLGHLTPLIVTSSLGRFEVVQFFSRLIATVLPVLDYFKIDAAIASSNSVSLTYLLATGTYSLLYCVFSLLLALILFDSRDLA